jgi:mevalonate kinase
MIYDIEQKSYPSKLLLFGEYTVLIGSQSLAVPFPNFKLHFTRDGDNHFNQTIKAFHNYLSGLDFSKWNVSFMAERYQQFFEQGYRVVSEIPVGYGVGSSGAVTAAVFDLFFEKSRDFDLVDLPVLTKILATIENFFHGKSSGIDPLIIYLNHPVISDPVMNFTPIRFNRALYNDYQVYLIDSGISRRTDEYVKKFNHKRITDPVFSINLDRIKTLNNELINQVKNNAFADNNSVRFKELSVLQYEGFTEMIPGSIDKMWKKTLDSDEHIIKLCGAGGGGFFFLLSRQLEEFIHMFPKTSILKTNI